MTLSKSQLEIANQLGLLNKKYQDFAKLKAKDQITFLLLILRNSGVGICNGCGKINYLINHHWYESYNFPLKEQNKKICMSCNGILNRHQMEFFKYPLPPLPEKAKETNPWVASHILPTWDKQLKFLNLFMEWGNPPDNGDKPSEGGGK